jgi:hypothetical protein
VGLLALHREESADSFIGSDMQVMQKGREASLIADVQIISFCLKKSVFLEQTNLSKSTFYTWG